MGANRVKKIELCSILKLSAPFTRFFQVNGFIYFGCRMIKVLFPQISWPKFASLTQDFSSTHRRFMWANSLLALAVAGLEGFFVLLGRRVLEGSANPLHILAALVAIAALRAGLQASQAGMEIRALGAWLQEKRRNLMQTLQNSSAPIYRSSQARTFSGDLTEGLENCAQGIASYLKCRGAALHVLAFVPLLILVSWKGGALAALFILPAAAASRFKAARLAVLEKDWSHARHRIELEGESWAESLESMAGNGLVRQRGEGLLTRIGELRKPGWIWDLQRLIFPHLMELYLFILLAVLIALAVAWDGGLAGGGAHFLPFAFLMLLLYRPVREWARHYPLYLQGQARWQSHAALIDRITSVTAPARTAPAQDEFISIRGLYFSYGVPTRPQEPSPKNPGVFADLDLELDTRNAVLLCGPNGAGKTTLLRLLSGLEIPDRGIIRYPEALLHQGKPNLTYLPQRPVLDAGMLEDLHIFLKADKDQGQKLTQLLGLDSLLAKAGAAGDAYASLFPGAGLSGGERQRLRLAWAFSRSRPWLLLDEPTTGLPGGEREAIFSGLLDFRRKLCPHRHGVLLVSHEPGLARLCAQTVKLDGVPEKETA